MRSVLTRAFAVSMSLRNAESQKTATSAVFPTNATMVILAGFPAACRISYLALRSGLRRMARYCPTAFSDRYGQELISLRFILRAGLFGSLRGHRMGATCLCSGLGGSKWCARSLPQSWERSHPRRASRLDAFRPLRISVVSGPRYAMASSWNGVFVRHVTCSVTTSFRASATFAFLGPSVRQSPWPSCAAVCRQDSDRISRLLPRRGISS